MASFTDYLLNNGDGFRVVIDHRAAAHIAPVPATVRVEPSGTTNPARDISTLAREAEVATAYVSRGGTIFVLALHGSGRVVYEAVKGAPSALQRRAITVIEDALAVARGDAPVKRAVEVEPVVEVALLADPEIVADESAVDDRGE